MKDKMWLICDYEYADGKIIRYDFAWKRWYTRSDAIETASSLCCNNASLIDSNGNIEVIKKDGEMLV